MAADRAAGSGSPPTAVTTGRALPATAGPKDHSAASASIHIGRTGIPSMPTSKAQPPEDAAAAAVVVAVGLAEPTRACRRRQPRPIRPPSRPESIAPTTAE